MDTEGNRTLIYRVQTDGSPIELLARSRRMAAPGRAASTNSTARENRTLIQGFGGPVVTFTSPYSAPYGNRTRFTP